MSEYILDLQDVTVQFGGLRAVSDVCIHIDSGEFVGLIGPNGAGKTTIFNLITGSIPPTEGTILFKGQSIAGKRPDQLCHMGIARTFQNIRLFPEMTAYENVALGIHAKPQYSFAEAFVRTPSAIRSEVKSSTKVYELLDLVGLKSLALERANSLPYGLQRRLELARAMATSPSLLLLDEPAAGMNEDECEDLIQTIRNIHNVMGYAIMLIEHHMNVVMELCKDSRLYVLNLGQILAAGTPQEVQSNPHVIKAYLGEKDESHV